MRATSASTIFSHEEKARAYFENTQNEDSLSAAFAPIPLAPDTHNTRRVGKTRRPLVFECRDETTCLRPNVLTGHIVSLGPGTTESKTLRVELQRTPQSTSANQKRATNRRNHQSHCCRTTKSAPIGTPLTPWRAKTRQ